MGLLDDLADLVKDPEIRRLAERRARSPELVEDALQETFRTVAQTQQPESIRDLRAFFCKSLIHEINHQLARPRPILADDAGSIWGHSQEQPPPSGPSPPVSVEGEAHMRLLAGAVLARLERDRDELMDTVPARSGDGRRYQSATVTAALTILLLLVEGSVTSADWNAVLRAGHPQWYDEPGLAHDARHQRLSRARRDVRVLLQAILPRDELAS
jgi:DNA-directed RNA polymerase specialized sigma24 family protein